MCSEAFPVDLSCLTNNYVEYTVYSISYFQKKQNINNPYYYF